MTGVFRISVAETFLKCYGVTTLLLRRLAEKSWFGRGLSHVFRKIISVG